MGDKSHKSGSSQSRESRGKSKRRKTESEANDSNGDRPSRSRESRGNSKRRKAESEANDSNRDRPSRSKGDKKEHGASYLTTSKRARPVKKGGTNTTSKRTKRQPKKPKNVAPEYDSLNSSAVDCVTPDEFKKLMNDHDLECCVASITTRMRDVTKQIADVLLEHRGNLTDYKAIAKVMMKAMLSSSEIILECIEALFPAFYNDLVIRGDDTNIFEIVMKWGYNLMFFKDRRLVDCVTDQTYETHKLSRPTNYFESPPFPNVNFNPQKPQALTVGTLMNQVSYMSSNWLEHAFGICKGEIPIIVEHNVSKGLQKMHQHAKVKNQKPNESQAYENVATYLNQSEYPFYDGPMTTFAQTLWIVKQNELLPFNPSLAEFHAKYKDHRLAKEAKKKAAKEKAAKEAKEKAKKKKKAVSDDESSISVQEVERESTPSPPPPIPSTSKMTKSGSRRSCGEKTKIIASTSGTISGGSSESRKKKRGLDRKCALSNKGTIDDYVDVSDDSDDTTPPPTKLVKSGLSEKTHPPRSSGTKSTTTKTIGSEKKRIADEDRDSSDAENNDVQPHSKRIRSDLDDQIRGSHSIRRDGKEREGDGGRESPPPPAANNAADPDDASLSTPKLTEAGPSSMSSGRGDNRDGVNRPISKHAKGSSVSKSTVGGEIAQSQTVKNLVSSSHERRREFGQDGNGDDDNDDDEGGDVSINLPNRVDNIPEYRRRSRIRGVLRHNSSASEDRISSNSRGGSNNSRSSSSQSQQHKTAKTPDNQSSRAQSSSPQPQQQQHQQQKTKVTKTPDRRSSTRNNEQRKPIMNVAPMSKQRDRDAVIIENFMNFLTKQDLAHYDLMRDGGTAAAANTVGTSYRATMNMDPATRASMMLNTMGIGLPPPPSNSATAGSSQDATYARIKTALNRPDVIFPKLSITLLTPHDLVNHNVRPYDSDDHGDKNRNSEHASDEDDDDERKNCSDSDDDDGSNGSNSNSKNTSDEDDDERKNCSDNDDDDRYSSSDRSSNPGVDNDYEHDCTDVDEDEDKDSYYDSDRVNDRDDDDYCLYDDDGADIDLESVQPNDNKVSNNSVPSDKEKECDDNDDAVSNKGDKDEDIGCDDSDTDDESSAADDESSDKDEGNNKSSSSSTIEPGSNRKKNTVIYVSPESNNDGGDGDVAVMESTSDKDRSRLNNNGCKSSKMSKSKRFTKKRENKNKKRDIERLRRQQQHQHQQQQERGDDLVTTQPLIPDHMAQLISGGGEGGREGGDNSTKRTESETMPNTDVSDEYVAIDDATQQPPPQPTPLSTLSSSSVLSDVVMIKEILLSSLSTSSPTTTATTTTTAAAATTTAATTPPLPPSPSPSTTAKIAARKDIFGDFLATPSDSDSEGSVTSRYLHKPDRPTTNIPALAEAEEDEGLVHQQIGESMMQWKESIAVPSWLLSAVPTPILPVLVDDRSASSTQKLVLVATPPPPPTPPPQPPHSYSTSMPRIDSSFTPQLLSSLAARQIRRFPSTPRPITAYSSSSSSSSPPPPPPPLSVTAQSPSSSVRFRLIPTTRRTSLPTPNITAITTTTTSNLNDSTVLGASFNHCSNSNKSSRRKSSVLQRSSDISFNNDNVCFEINFVQPVEDKNLMKHDIDDGDNYVEAVVCRMEVPVSARVPMETMANCEESARAIRESWAKLQTNIKIEPIDNNVVVAAVVNNNDDGDGAAITAAFNDQGLDDECVQVPQSSINDGAIEIPNTSVDGSGGGGVVDTTTTINSSDSAVDNRMMIIVDDNDERVDTSAAPTDHIYLSLPIDEREETITDDAITNDDSPSRISLRQSIANNNGAGGSVDGTIVTDTASSTATGHRQQFATSQPISAPNQAAIIHSDTDTAMTTVSTNEEEEEDNGAPSQSH